VGPHYVRRLEAAAHKLGETNISFAGVPGPSRLPLSRVIRVEAKHYNSAWQAIDVTAAFSPHWAKSIRPSKPAQSPASKTEPDAARHQGRAVVGGRRSGLTLLPCQGLG